MERFGERNFVFFILCIIGMMSNTLSVAYPDYHFKHYDINNGLSQNTVFSIFQDKQGFMWFGTKDGLNRFDGKSFKTFHFSPGGNLRDNVFRRILQDPEDNLWVATEEGVYVYNTHLESFSRFENTANNNQSIDGTVSDMIMDGEGDIWMSVEEKGVFQYNISKDELSFYEVPLFTGGMKILTLCAGKNNDIWVFPYSHNFLRIDKRTKKISEFPLKDNPSLMADAGEISFVLADRYNDLILCTSQQGLLNVNTVDSTHKAILQQDEHGNPVFVRSIARIDNNTLWIGTESGIYIYNSQTHETINLKHHKSIPHSLSDNAVYSIYKDRDNGIWVGTYFGGVNYYSNQTSGFEMFYSIPNINSVNGERIREFCPAENGNIWIGTEDAGLNLFNPHTNTFLPIDNRLKNLYTNIHALYNDGRYFWISTFSKGLNRYDIQTGNLNTYTQFDVPETIIQNSVFALCKDRQNMLWIGTLSGVNIYDYAHDRFSLVKDMEGISVQDIMEDTDGNVWIASFHKGLFRFDPNTKKWHNFRHNPADTTSLAYDKTTSIFEDSKRRLWITTQGGGICFFNKERQTFTTINSGNGLINNVVYQILEDAKGYFWLSTNGGIVRFKPETNSFKNYTINNGLKTNQFNYQSGYKDENGVLYFGSVDGFVRFRPTDFEEMNKELPVVFTDFQINNYPANIGADNSPLSASIQHTENICLPYNKNSISLRYAMMDYSGLNTLNIVYKLDGFDKEWLPSNVNNTIIYTNLPSGKYKLLLAYENEIENSNYKIIKTLDIRIKYPFWKTWWAYLVYVLLVIGIILGAILFIHRRNEKVQQQRMRVFQQEKERELYKSKIDFFTNVAHEIRTPLSLIKAPLDQVLQTNNLPPDIKENLVIMDKNTERLLTLTNQLLDFRKTESDLYTLNLKVYNVSRIVQETISRFIPFAEQNKIALSANLPETDLLAQIDKEAFIKIISNLLNNAIKYGESYVNVTLNTVLDENKLPAFEFATQNDGAVVSDRYKKDIFKSFVHIDENRKKNVNGTGIGLALAKSLTQLLKGNLTYSNDGGHNTFRLVLPVGTIDTRAVSSVSPPSDKPKIIEEAKRKEPTVALLVEDDLEMGNFLEKCIKGAYFVLRASNGKEALEILKAQTVNIIVSDVMMPEMNGFELTKTLKSDIESSHIPVVLLTAKTNNQSKIKGYEAGADAYIEKPFSVDVLLARMTALLQNRRYLQSAFIKNPLIGAVTVAITKSDEKFIKKLNGIVQESISNPDFNVEDMAGIFNMSRASFYRKIKGVLNLTPNEYIRVERLKKAAILLKEKEYKVNEICYMVGFNSPSYFSKCFQQQFGVLPKDFI